MAFIVTPGQLTARAAFYHQLGASLGAGLNIVRALRLLARNPPGRGLSRQITALADRVEAGSTITEAATALGNWLPPFDLALIGAGEQSGRLDLAFRTLAQACDARAKLARQVLMGLAYPAVLFHVAFLIVPVGRLVTLVRDGDVAGFLMQKAAFFLPVYGGILLAVLALQSSRGNAWRALLESASGFVPILGKARQALSLSRLALALDALLAAGVTPTRAWPLAAAASASPALERETTRWVTRLEAGDSVGELILASRAFPQHFSSIYSTAEISGRVDEALPRLSAYYQDEGLRGMRVSAGILTGLVYAVVMILAVIEIFSFWLGHYGAVLDAL